MWLKKSGKKKRRTERGARNEFMPRWDVNAHCSICWAVFMSRQDIDAHCLIGWAGFMSQLGFNALLLLWLLLIAWIEMIIRWFGKYSNFCLAFAFNWFPQSRSFRLLQIDASKASANAAHHRVLIISIYSLRLHPISKEWSCLFQPYISHHLTRDWTRRKRC